MAPKCSLGVMEPVLIKLVANPEEMAAARAVRRRVFIEEQGVPPNEEYDEYDDQATHAVAIHAGQVVGTGRMYRDATGAARIGRMAVDGPWRRHDVGGRLLEALEAEARRLGIFRALLHAQTYVQQFYAGHGYLPEGDIFMEAGIEHVAMSKPLG
jgi:predicted GNAT family N-acyltransferase